jgi:ATP-dependent helicase HrpB
MQPLPIDPLVGEIAETLARSQRLVLEAPPGAGKTTRVPWALLESLGQEGEIIVTEPRRLAARMAARRVASERGERLGGRVGYSVRFEEVSGPSTRLKYVTEGVLLRRLLDDRALRGVRAVVLDEFHERHLTTDLLLTLIAALTKSRSDLGLLVMSATLDAEPVARFLGDCPRLRSEGRMFPVSIEHLSAPDDRPLEKQVVSATRSAIKADPEGDVLVFLPGASEIRRALEALEGLGRESGRLLLPLHGDLPIAEQARAVEPADRPKVVLATNVAESSVTIDGVTTVIDSGLARVAAHSPWSGLPQLATQKVSRASAIQRAGRAGRTREGKVLRLYTRGDFESRPEHDLPEIARADLSEALLALHGAGVSSPAELTWFTAPPAAHLKAAEELLFDLGAIDRAGKLTRVGERLLAFPLHPRQARIVVEGEARGVAEDACLVAALLGERDIRRDARTDFGSSGERQGGATGPSDLLELCERFREGEGTRSEQRLRSLGLDPRSFQAVERARRQLERVAKNRVDPPSGVEALDQALLACIVTGFPDRLARRRRPGQPDLVLVSGSTAKLSPRSVVRERELMVAVDVEERPGRGVEVRLASAADENLLYELYGDRIQMSEELVYNADKERVERVERISIGSIVLEETRSAAPPSEESARVLLGAVRARAHEFAQGDALGGLSARLELARAEFPDAGLPANTAEAVETALAAACETTTSLADLRAMNLAELFASNLSPSVRRLLEEEFPERVRLPGGRSVVVHYEPGKPPWIESRLQDFFGMKDGPRVARGRIPLTLHLLAPNQRAVQVTTDLAGFWERHYPGIRKELMRRYPRHSWPEDGRTAAPPPPRGR